MIISPKHTALTFFFAVAMYFWLGESSTWASISHTKIPETIKVGITGFYYMDDWINAGSPVESTLQVHFKEYIKDVLPQEWYSDDNPNANIEILKVGAMANKTFAWWRINGDERHGLEGSPDVVDNTADQVYIPLSCTGQETASNVGTH